MRLNTSRRMLLEQANRAINKCPATNHYPCRHRQALPSAKRRVLCAPHEFNVASYETSFLATSLEKSRILTACENSASYIQLLA